MCAPVTVAYCEVIMDAPGGAREPRFGSPYGMGLLGEVPDMYGAGRPPSALGLRPGMQACPGPRGVKRPSEQCYDERPSPSLGLEHCAMPDMADDGYASLQPKKSPPSNGKKTKGRVKIKMEYIDNKLRRYTTFSKRKTGIMKKAYELSTLTGTQVMLLVASETGHVYTFATRKLQPMITSDSGKRLIQTCLNSPDPPSVSEQRMAATGFEETELTYNVVDDDMKDEPASSGDSGDESGSEPESPSEKLLQQNHKQDWVICTDKEREINRETPSDNQPSTSTSNPEPESSKSSQPSLPKLLPKIDLPGGAMLYHSSVLGLDGLGSNLGLGNLAMGYPHSFILGLANQGQEGASSSSTQPQFITIPLSMAMAAASGPTPNGCPSASSDDSSELQDLSTGGRK
ncbi:serum response factor homolog isoform X2 [Maniola jurtina]|uniref:serum response factor homolog isoform X2 n=1 Tax=Maniola jurtina TaxID=191418 RepID=UPI001E68FBE6|nr:serum response factor homolog isoform X2 [Maniola jurtina]